MIFLPKQTNHFCSPLYTYTHEHTHFTSNRHLPIAPWSSLLLNTGAHKHWTEFRLQQILQCRESADEVCQHASLITNSQKTTGNQRAPVYGWQGIAETRGGVTFSKIFRLNSSSRSGAPLSNTRAAFPLITNSFTQHIQQCKYETALCLCIKQTYPLRLTAEEEAQLLTELNASRRGKVVYLWAGLTFHIKSKQSKGEVESQCVWLCAFVWVREWVHRADPWA